MIKDGVMRYFWICGFVSAFLTPILALAWWAIWFYRIFLGGTAIFALGGITLMGNTEDGQKLFAAGLGTVIGAAIGYFWLGPVLAQFL